MKPPRSLFNSIDPIDQIQETSPFGKNGIQDYLRGSIINEPGFTQSTAIIPYTPIGVIETDTRPIIFSTNGSKSSIGFFNPELNSYELILNDTTAGFNLGFNLEWYITGEYQKNNYGEYEIVFTDKHSDLKFLNASKPNVTTIEDMLFHLRAKTPDMAISVDAGGELAYGSYTVSLKYTRIDGAETSYLLTSAPQTVSGTAADLISDKALRIELTNLDQSYDFVVIAIIKRIKGQVSAVEMDPVAVGEKVSIVYSGTNVTQPIALEEILIAPRIYKSVQTIGQLNGSLYLGGLTEEDEVEFQPYANLAQVRWTSEMVDLSTKPVEILSGAKKGFAHDEVYAFYIRLKLIAGGFSKAFCVPGPAPRTSDLVDQTLGGITAKKFQLSDTVRSVNGRSGVCGVWQNQNETYPDHKQFDSSTIGGENLRGQLVRHHKMPSMNYIKDNLNDGDSTYGRSQLDILGIRVSNLTIPLNLRNRVDGYEVLFAKRTTGNSTVFGQSLLLYAGQDLGLLQQNTQSGFASSGGNWIAVSEMTKNRSLTKASDNPIHLKMDRVRLHPFELLFNKPSLPGNSYLTVNLKLRTPAILIGPGYAPNIAQGSLERSDARGLAYLLDYTKNNAAVPTAVPAPDRARKLTKLVYAANNINTGEFDNTSLETAVVGQLSQAGPAIAESHHYVALGKEKLREYDTARLVTHEETYLTTLKALKNNLYQSFLSQTLIATGKVLPLTPSDTVLFTGDTFPCEYTYHTYGWNGGGNPTPDGDATPETQGVRVIRKFLCESVANINQRYEIVGNQYSLWYENTSVAYQNAYILYYGRSQDPNQFGYSKDLNSLNDFQSVSIYNPGTRFIGDFPHRIHRGGKAKREGSNKNWRTLLPLDYYDMPKNRGPVVNLLGMDDTLLIHMQNALFVTQDKTKLEADILSITLGSGDIFQFDPQEGLSSKLGLAGTRHDLACVHTPIGYMFVDAALGQVFLYKQGLKLLNGGLDTFLRDYAVLTANNPFRGNGITIGYDPEFNRILLTVKNRLVLDQTYTIVPNYRETPEFFATLVANQSLVYKDGRWQVFKGVNATAFQCTINLPPTIIGTNGTIPENAATGTQAASVIGTDPENAQLSYTIVAGNIGNVFSVNSTGKILLNGAGMVDFETLNLYILTVQATDPKGLFAQTLVSIAITDVIEPPSIPDYTVTISELILAGANVQQVVGTGTGTLTYSILSGNDQGAFIINSSTGQITVLNDTKIVYESTPIFNLVVQVSNGVAVDQGIVQINVTSVNEPPISVNKTVTIPQATTAGTLVLTYDPAIDPEESTIIYTLQSATVPGMFTVNLATRAITLAPGKVLSYTTNPQHIIVVRASDGDLIDPRYTDIVLTINVFAPCILTVSFDEITQQTATTASAKAIPNSGTGPFTYLWSNGQTTQVATNLTKTAQYTVDVVDSQGCTATGIITPNVTVLSGLKLEVMFFGKTTLVTIDPYYPRLCYLTHNCNRAKYNVKANGVTQGIANMNNANGDGGAINTDDGNVPPGYPNYDNPSSNDRYWGKTLSGADAAAIANAQGEVVITLVYIGTIIPPHSDAVTVRISKINGTVLAQACVDTFAGYTFNPYA